MAVMENVLTILAAGAAVGFYIRDYRAKKEQAQSEQQAERHADQIKTLSRQVAALKKEIADRQETDERQRREWLKADLSNPQNQLRFVSECHLKAVTPVNNEASRVLYAIDEWIQAEQPDWRFGFEVAMGAFIQTSYPSDKLHQKRAFRSYNSKRVDFLLIDRSGAPILVVEYNGSGHDLSGDADARMKVKRLALQKAAIPLLEIPEGMGKDEIFAALSRMV